MRGDHAIEAREACLLIELVLLCRDLVRVSRVLFKRVLILIKRILLSRMCIARILIDQLLDPRQNTVRLMAG